jgi:hypothetical protein
VIETFANLPDWTFDIIESSPNVYLMRGTDKRGHALRFEGTEFVALHKAMLDDALRFNGPEDVIHGLTSAREAPDGHR